MKTCTKCGAEKPCNEFSNNKHWCKVCVSVYNTKYRKNNEQSIKIQQAAHYQSNKKAIRAKQIKYREGHPDLAIVDLVRLNKWNETHPLEAKARSLKHAKAHPEKLQLWKKKNPQKVNANTAARKSKRLNATPAWVIAELIALKYADAIKISQMTGIKCHVDHIIPLRSKLVCGLHVEYNLQILSQTENISKGNRVWPDMP